MRKALLAICLLCLSACTDAEMKDLTSYGSEAFVTCYSGGKVIFDGKSTGKVLEESGGAGYQFKDSATNKFVRINGDCIILN